uniref:1-acyl-sn-glycerol-3-phosphate acyltransferase n=1 Tax=Aureoumbra lagunensis TaxID=44058 RepID=A0A7S3K3P6_9STRA
MKLSCMRILVLVVCLPLVVESLVIPGHSLIRRRSCDRREQFIQKKVEAAAVAYEDESLGPSVGPLSIKIGKKDVNLAGLFFGLSMTLWVITLYPLVLACALLSQIFDKKRRRAMDFIVSLWARFSMLTCGYRPKLIGVENLPLLKEAVLYVPNHTSYLDILTLSGFLKRPFKYISKIEILRIPLIGWAMGFAGHVALKRTDRRSQLETFKAAVESLSNGNSIVAFPEGTRALNGKLQKFKRGPFKMATAANVDIIPIAICDLHKWHPPSALLPLARPSGVQIKVLPRISTKDNQDADDILDQAFDAINAALPAHQQHGDLRNSDL